MVDGTTPEFGMAIQYGQSGRTVVALSGELDIANLGRLQRVLLALLEDCCALIRVDLRELRFVDVPGIRLLAELWTEAQDRPRPLEVTGASVQVAPLFDLICARLAQPVDVF
jgi:anti-anti-sigma factor